MLIFGVVSLVVLLTGIAIGVYNEDFDGFGGIFTILGGILLVIFLGIMPFISFTSKDFIAEHKSVQVTIDSQRTVKLSEFERATITGSIMEQNKELARWRQQNTFWRSGLFINDEVDELSPIR